MTFKFATIVSCHQLCDTDSYRLNSNQKILVGFSPIFHFPTSLFIMNKLWLRGGERRHSLPKYICVYLKPFINSRVINTVVVISRCIFNSKHRERILIELLMLLVTIFQLAWLVFQWSQSNKKCDKVRLYLKAILIALKSYFLKSIFQASAKYSAVLCIHLIYQKIIKFCLSLGVAIYLHYGSYSDLPRRCLSQT